MSDPTIDAGEPAEKRVRKTRVAKAAAPADAVSPDSPSPAVPVTTRDAAPPAPAAPQAAQTQSQRPAPQHQQDGGSNSPPSAQADGNQDQGNRGNDGNNSQDGNGGFQGQRNQGNQAGANQGNNPGNQNNPNNPRRDRFKNRRDRQRDRYRDGDLPDDGGNNETFVPRPHPQVPEGFPQYSLGDLKRLPAHKLIEIAEQLQISEGVARARKQDIIFAVLKVLTRHGEGVAADGVLEILPDGFGFLRAAEASYLAGPDDTYISPSQIRRFNLRTGDHLSGRIRWPKDGERYFALSIVDTINGEPLEASKNKALFENLTALFPRKKFKLERGDGSSEDITGRILDLMAPQGKGQRALIVSPPKAGKTMMMQQVASAITYNHPDVHLIVLLIDERPEEVTEMQRTVRGEVISS
ncbi:MAG: Rho termination factor N-terminal domain-containing protein, partial [Pseudomonadota bacterium]